MADEEQTPRSFILRRRARFIVAAAAIGSASAPVVACGEENVCLSIRAPVDASEGGDASDGSDAG